MPATDGHVLRRPHRTDGLITLHVGVLTKILALTTTECKARSRALSPMRSGRNNLRRGRGGPTERAYTPGAGGSAQRSLPWLFRTKLCTPCLLSGRAQQNSPSAGPPPTLPRNNSPNMELPAAYPRKSSPNAGPPPGHPRKSSPNAPENSIFRPFWACRANFFALTPTSSRAGRIISRTGHRHVPTSKPTAPLQPLMQASMKPPSPLLAPRQHPLKPATPLQPKNTLKTPIFHPQRRRRFQLAHLTSPQR